METAVSFINSQGLKLAGILARTDSSKPTPVVVMCHGYSSGKNSKINRLLVPRLAELGITSFRFDFLGHYDSEGDIADLTISAAVDELTSGVRYLKKLETIDTDRLGIFGSSFGGTAALWFTSSTADVSALVLRSPISDYAAVREQQLGSQGIREWKRKGVAYLEGGTVESRYSFYEDAKAHDTYELVKKIAAPTLIIHGDADDNVPLSQSERLSKAMGKWASLEVVPNAGHSYDKPGQLDHVVDLTVAFLRSKLTE